MLYKKEADILSNYSRKILATYSKGNERQKGNSGTL
jgi:hypothetical protein